MKSAIMARRNAQEKRPRWGRPRPFCQKRSGGLTAAEMGRAVPASHLTRSRHPEWDTNSKESWRNKGIRSRIRAPRGTSASPFRLISRPGRGSSGEARRLSAPPPAQELPPVSVTGHDSLKCRRTLDVGGKHYDYFSLEAAAAAAGLGDISRLPFSLKVLLENLVRLENGRTVTVEDIKSLGAWLKSKTSEREIAFRPARVLMQDLTGVPAVVDLAAMREAMGNLGGDPKRINPLVAGRSRHRPFGDGRQFRQQGFVREERQDRVRAQRRALCLSALGPERVRQFPRRAARHRHLPPGQSRISGAGGVDDRGEQAARSLIPIRSSAPTAIRRW